MERRYGHSRLKVVSLMALQLGTCKCSRIRDILVGRGDWLPNAETPEWSILVHVRLRGPGLQVKPVKLSN